MRGWRSGLQRQEAFWQALGRSPESERPIALGAVLFACGVVWFFVSAVGRSRDEDVGIGTAMARASRDALRFALDLMP